MFVIKENILKRPVYIHNTDELSDYNFSLFYNQSVCYISLLDLNPPSVIWVKSKHIFSTCAFAWYCLLNIYGTLKAMLRALSIHKNNVGVWGRGVELRTLVSASLYVAFSWKFDTRSTHFRNRQGVFLSYCSPRYFFLFIVNKSWNNCV
jgi:hypothetical protein